MSLVDIINTYWQTIFGIISFVFACGYTYSQMKEVARLREQDYKNFIDKLKEQKENHDAKIGDLQQKVVASGIQIDTLKDRLSEAISKIQLDIREIMTLLKGGEK